MSESKFPWRTLLLVSGAVNLLAVGALIGAVAAGVRLERRPHHEAATQMPVAPRAMVAALPPEVQQKIRAEMAPSYGRTVEQRRAAAEARRAAFEAATAEPYDVARVRGAFARMRAADQDAVAVFHDDFAEALGALTPEERRAALEALRASSGERFRERRERRMQRLRERRDLERP